MVTADLESLPTPFQVYGLWGFNATINNISVMSWRSVFLVEETRVHGENHRPATSHWQTLSHNVVSSTPLLSIITGKQIKKKTQTLEYLLHILLYKYFTCLCPPFWDGQDLYLYITCNTNSHHRKTIEKHTWFYINISYYLTTLENTLMTVSSISGPDYPID